MQVSIHESIADIDPSDWNQLAGRNYPFLRHEFLRAAESTGCVAAETGWVPLHLCVRNDGQLQGAMPLYAKDHSWGEFVFDWAWAQAYERAGIHYYPKLVSATPFTPATSGRLLVSKSSPPGVAKALLQGAIQLAREGNYSSLHIQFPRESELPVLRDAGLIIRRDCQFHWHNDNYASFDDFLATFSASKRKKARRDRRHVLEAGITFRRLSGRDIDEATWLRIYGLISMTFLRRGSMPYYDEEFFLKISRSMPEQLLVVIAEKDETAIAAAIFFIGDDTLYGRYWGSNADYNALHFETCYYQGIDYCIDHGLQVFEPGTQGEHKISRGFVPVSTWSAHWLAKAEFAAAIENFVSAESRHVDRYMRLVDDHSPYRDDGQDSE